MPKIITKEMEEKIVSFYAEKPISISALGEKFNLSSPTVMKILNKHGVERYKKAQIFNPNMNEDYFETIDNQNKAYFLGMIISDGNVFKEGGDGNRQASVSITLTDSDNYILQKFKDEVNVNTSIASDSRGSSTIAVRSDKMASDLSKYGVVQRKSFITYLPIIDKPLMGHLIRGILDGDGSVQAKQTNVRNKYKHSVGFCGSNLLMTQIKDWLVENLGISNRLVYEYRDKSLSMVTWSSIKDMELLYHLLYDDADVYLIRKRDKFDSIMNHYGLK